MADIVVSYSGDIDKLQADLKKLEKQQLAVDKTSKKTTDTITKGSENASKSVSKVNKEVITLDKTFAKVGGAIAGVFAVGQIISIGKEIVNTTAKFQKFEAVLTNTLGSKSDAQKALEMIKNFAASTPFAVEELTDSFVKLANQGFKPTQEEMRKLGDLAASQGKSFNQLTEAIIDAQTGEFERLKEFGIRAQKEGDKVRFTFKGVQTQTDFTSDSIRKYVLELGDLAGVSGGMAAISQTLGGQISNLGDSWDSLLLAFGSQSGGVFSVVIDLLGLLTSGVTDFVKASDTAVESWRKQGDSVKNLEENVVPLIDRYEELSNKSNLSKKEQDELDNIIVQIGKDIPTAITQFDEYGKAIGISTKEARGFIEAQKAILAIKNKEAIEEQTEALEKLNKKIRAYQTDLNKGTKLAADMDGVTYSVKLTSEEILAYQKVLNNLQFEKLGVTGLIDELKGVKKEVKEVVKEIEEPAKKLTEFEKLLADEREKIRKKELESRVKDLLRWEQLQKEAGLKEINDTEITEKGKTTATDEGLKERHKSRVEEMKKFKSEVTDPIIKYGKEAEEEQTRKLIEEEAKRKQIRQQALSEIINMATTLANGVADIKHAKITQEIEEERAANETKANNEIQALQRRNEEGIISDAQFAAKKAQIDEKLRKKEAQLKKRQFEADQKAALTRIAIDTAVSVAKTAATAGYPAAIPLIVLALAQGAIQAALVKSQPVPKFKDGVIDLQGKGTETSDSISAKLSKGESVMTAKETKRHKPLFKAIREGSYDDYINRNHILPHVKKLEKEQRDAARRKEGFAEKLMESIALNSVDTSHLERLTKKNKSVRIENASEIVEGIKQVMKPKSRGL